MKQSSRLDSKLNYIKLSLHYLRYSSIHFHFNCLFIKQQIDRVGGFVEKPLVANLTSARPLVQICIQHLLLHFCGFLAAIEGLETKKSNNKKKRPNALICMPAAAEKTAAGLKKCLLVLLLCRTVRQKSLNTSSLKHPR